MTFKDAVRLDLMPIGKVQRLDNGFLRVPITVTRVGIFVYRLDDGTEWREFRPPEEVFKRESMESLKGVPVTNDHPSFGLLNADNASEVMVGFTSDDVSRQDDYLKSWMTLTEKATIGEVEAKKKTEISAGYLCDVIEKSGTWRGEKYDAIQSNIRYNHAAIVKRARAGAEAKIHLDSDQSKPQRALRLDSFLTPDETKIREDNMEKSLTINGVEYKLSPEAYAAITGRFTADSQAITGLGDKLKTAETERATAQGRADSFETEVKKMKEAAPEGSGKSIKLDSDEFRECVAKRVQLELFAKRRLDSDVTKMTDKDIIVALIKLDDENFKAEGRKAEDIYLQARLDGMMDAASDQDDDEDDDETRLDNEDDDDQSGGDQERNDSSDSSYKRGKNAIGRKERNDSNGGRNTKEKSADEKRTDHMRKASQAWEKPIGMHQKS